MTSTTALLPQDVSRRERHLLGLAALFILLNQSMLLISLQRPVWQFWNIGVWGLCATVVHLQARRLLPQRDPYLLPSMFLLMGWGLTAIDRLQPTFADRQAVWIAVSSVALVGLWWLPHHLRWLQNWHWHWLGLGILSLMATVFFGVNPSGVGPRLWLGGGDLFYQPSELLKLIVILFLAVYFSRNASRIRYRLFDLRLMAPTALVLLICMLVLILQRDLGTATLFFLIYLLMLYLTSGHWIVLVAGGAVISVTTAIAYAVYDLVRLRIDIWLNPWPQADDRAFQIVQSLMAVAAGSLLGSGVGQGIPTFVPVAHSDFIFAAIAEEWGFIGVMGLLFTLLLLIFRGLRIAMQAPPLSFSALLAAGVSLLIATQSLMIIGGTLRLWPLTGVTVPLVSYGGSSLLATTLAVGLLLILSNQQHTQDAHDN
jgi:cell division protein FtsW (lipid II flippase)